MITKTATESTAQWMARNPLKMWRKMSGIPMPEIAATIGVSMTAIQKWECGSSRPNYSNMAKLSRYTDGAVESLIWDEWEKGAPVI